MAASKGKCLKWSKSGKRKCLKRVKSTRRKSRSMGATPFKRGNKFATALKLTKGRTCDRKKILKAVKRGTTPRSAVSRFCD